MALGNGQTDPRLLILESRTDELEDKSHALEILTARIEERLGSIDDKLDQIVPAVEQAKTIAATWGTVRRILWVICGAVVSGAVGLLAKML